MVRALIVFGAGGLGATVRWLISLWATERFGTGFPYGTLIVNVLGSFVMTLVMELSLRMAEFPADLRLALTTGFLGGLTTYSSFNYESSTLALGGDTLKAAANIGITLVACVAAGLLGLVLARKLS